MTKVKLNIDGAIKFKIEKFKDKRGFFCTLDKYFKTLRKYKLKK